MNRLWLVFLGLLASPSIGQDKQTEMFADRVPSQSQIEDIGEGGRGAANSSDAWPLLTMALDLIKDFEGWSEDAYDDPADYCTIGYGHLIALKKCSQIDLGTFEVALQEPAEGTELLERDTQSARLAVQSLVQSELSDEQFGALASFVFNVGKENFRSSTMLKLLNEGEYDLVAKQFARWVKAKGEVLPGLVVRRACEEALFRDALVYGKDGKFIRSACVSMGAAPSADTLIDVEVGEP